MFPPAMPWGTPSALPTLSRAWASQGEDLASSLPGPFRWATTAVCIQRTLRVSNRLSSPFHRDNGAQQALMMKTNSAIISPQHHFIYAFCSFLLFQLLMSVSTSHQQKMILWCFPFGKCSPGNTVSRQQKSINPNCLIRNWMNLTIC